MAARALPDVHLESSSAMSQLGCGHFPSFVFWGLHPDAGAVTRDDSVVKGSSTTAMSLKGCCHPGNFVLTFSQRVFSVWSTCLWTGLRACLGVHVLEHG